MSNIAVLDGGVLEVEVGLGRRTGAEELAVTGSKVQLETSVSTKMRAE